MDSYTYHIEEFRNGDVLISFILNDHIISQETISRAKERKIDVVAFANGRIDDYEWAGE